MANNQNNTLMYTVFFLTLALGLGGIWWAWQVRGADVYGHDIDMEMVTVSEQANQRAHAVIDAVFPEQYRDRILEISAGTDGRFKTRAYVQTLDDKGITWRLVYDTIDTFDDSDRFHNLVSFYQTVIHELGHIISLNDEQIDYFDPYRVREPCPSPYLEVDRGCAVPDSYIALFINQFWANAAVQSLDDDEGYLRYDLKRDAYVSQYAATSPYEDFCETLVEFVLRDTLDSAQTTAEQKIAFLGQFDELRAIRDHIRGAPNFIAAFSR